MAKTLLAGWSQVPGNRNRMISPTGETVTYYQYRNQAVKQSGFKSYHDFRKMNDDGGYVAKLNAASQLRASQTGGDLEKIKKELRRVDSNFNREFTYFQKEVKGKRVGIHSDAADILRKWGLKDDFTHKVGDTPKRKKE